MSLPAQQIKFINEQAKGKTPEEIKNMVGNFYKSNIRKFIKNKKRPQSMKKIMTQDQLPRWAITN